MKVRFDTEEYCDSHGQLPRGAGNWAFEFGPADDGDVVWAPDNVTFAQAKKYAEEHAQVAYPTAAYVVARVLP